MKFRPFVYISDSLVTNNGALNTILRFAKSEGYEYDHDLVKTIWNQSIYSIRAQNHKYNLLTSEFKQKGLRSWYKTVLDQLSPAFSGGSNPSKLLDSVFKQLVSPQNYTVNPKALDFILHIQKNDIRWGIIANDDYLYPLAVKYLRLNPWAVISAQKASFKPLPKIFHKAWSKVPVQSQHDVWFIGDARVDYDNIVSPYMRSAMYTHGEMLALENSQHMRIAEFSDLDPMLGLQQDCNDHPEEPAFDMGEKELQVLLDLPKSTILARGSKEIGLVDIEAKK